MSLSTSRKTRFVVSSFFVAATFILSSCSATAPATRPIQVSWITSGSAAVTKNLPSVNDSLDALLAFSPATAPHGQWLAINRKLNQATLMDGLTKVASAIGQGFQNLKRGRFALVHKQRNALWYAPDQYFTSRALPVPTENDRSRFLRGALGDFVMFLDEDTPIHSGPVWTKEIGGAQVGSLDLSRFYYNLPAGAEVRVE